MEVISLKLDKNMLKNIDSKLAKHNYSTRTEFVRDAVREKLEGMSRDDLIAEFMKLRGASKQKTTDEEIRRNKWIVSEQLKAELDKRFK